MKENNQLLWTLTIYFVHEPSANMEEAGFMTYTAASHQGDDQEDLASLIGAWHVVHLYLQPMVQTKNNNIYIIVFNSFKWYLMNS